MVSCRYFFTSENANYAPRRIIPSGVAIFDTSSTVSIMQVGSFIPIRRKTIPTKAPIIRGFVTTPLSYFLMLI